LNSRSSKTRYDPLTGKILNYLYLANDILQKSNSTDNTRMLKAFQTQMPDMINLVCHSNSDRLLFKEIHKVASSQQVLKLWKDRQVYPEAFMNNMLAVLEKTIQDKKKDRKEEMPAINFDIEDLYNYAHNKKHLDIWTEKVKELRTQLEIALKNSGLYLFQKTRSPRPSSSRSKSFKRLSKTLKNTDSVSSSRKLKCSDRQKSSIYAACSS